jgi:glucitol/sorbitol PTS system EIIA component
MKYEVTITNIGDFALQLLKMRDSMVIFDKDVPYQYMDMVVAHTKATFKEDVVVGDKLVMAGLEYTVTAVGEDAMKTLKDKGHCTLVFNGKETVEQPGQIALKGSAMPRVMVGDTIRFE